jgi:hypothetical protein
MMTYSSLDNELPSSQVVIGTHHSPRRRRRRSYENHQTGHSLIGYRLKHVVGWEVPVLFPSIDLVHTRNNHVVDMVDEGAMYIW